MALRVDTYCVLFTLLNFPLQPLPKPYFPATLILPPTVPPGGFILHAKCMDTNMSQYGFESFTELPATIPVFPLPGVLLLPRRDLPLNIFEPRYLSMVNDALGSQRLIGMIQPQVEPSGDAKTELMSTGCVGRITGFSETREGLYVIILSGLQRFTVAGELAVGTPYRQVTADYTSFARDLSSHDEADLDRNRLSMALRRYAESNGFKVDWEAMGKMEGEVLVNELSASCPFGPQERQELLEAPGLGERFTTLLALLEMGAAPPSGGADILH